MDMKFEAYLLVDGNETFDIFEVEFHLLSINM